MAKEVLVRYFNIIREVTGKSEERIILSDGGVLLDLIFHLVDIYGQSFNKHIFNDKGELNSYMHIARKGQLSMVNLEQKVNDDDEYYLFIVLSGG